MGDQFQTDRFDLIKADRVRLANYRYGSSEIGELIVSIDSSEKGIRFMRQIIVRGTTYPMLSGVYTQKCYILREKKSSSYYFLDINDCGIRLFNDTFFGSEHYTADQSKKIEQ